MAVTNQEVVLTFNADTGGVETATAKIGKNLEEANKATEGLNDELEDVAKSADKASDATSDLAKEAKASGEALEASADAGVTGFKAVGAALAATGLFGLLTKVLEPILAAFLENKTVAGALSAVMAGLGAVINSVVKVGEKLVNVLVDAFNNPQEALASITEKVTELKDRFVDAFSSPGNMLDSLKEKVIGFADTIKSYVTDKVTALIEGFGLLGKAIGAVFSGEFEEAASLAADGLTKIYIEANPVVDATKAVGSAMLDTAKAVGEFAKEAFSGSAQAVALDLALQDLADRERDLAVVTAQSRAEVEELKRQRDDERLSIEERIKFAEMAAEIDQRIADENVAIQEEKARLLRQEIELQGETEERLQAVADAEIAVADARGTSAGVQTELMTNIFGLNQQLIEQAREQLELLQETRDGLRDARADIEPIEQEEDPGAKTLMVQKMQTQAVETESEKRKRLRREEAEAFRDLVLGDEEMLIETTKNTLGVLADLNSAFEGDSEKEQKKAFERSKKIQAAQALISTYESAVSAYNSLVKVPLVGPVLGGLAAVAAVKAGLNNVQKIKSQTFQGSGGGEPDTPSTSLSAGAGAGVGAGTQAPQLDLSFLGEGAGQAEPIQAFVVAQDVSNAQQANQQIQDQATL
jgi:hypothetical protein